MSAPVANARRRLVEAVARRALVRHGGRRIVARRALWAEARRAEERRRDLRCSGRAGARVERLHHRAMACRLAARRLAPMVGPDVEAGR